ncbi:IS1-like element transposase [Klebsiella pneumoniae]|nr:IS1-like element transposase [Klebsiella pneumoniae]
MAFNGAGVCDTARTLKIGINTVIRTLKTRATTSNHISGCSCRCGAHLRTRRAMEVGSKAR